MASSSSNTTYRIKTPSGAILEFLTIEERDFFRAAYMQYTQQNVFTHKSDIRTLERLVFLETMVLRFQRWIGSGYAYDRWLDDREVEGVQRQLKDATTQIGNLQGDLGLTRAQRERDAHESVGAYITKLQQRAKDHGIRRDKQVGKAIELFMEIKSVCGTFLRSSEHERIKVGFQTADEIIDWILDEIAPQFDAVDEHYRNTNQKLWIRDMQ